MARLIILGSAAAVSDVEHDNTHFLLQGDHGSVILVDCGSNAIGKLSQHGIHFDQLTDLILTHFHPDHVYGVPILLMQMWLLGRQKPLRVYGLHHCLHRLRELMVSFMIETWPNFFPMQFFTVPEQDNMPVLETEDFRITSWPTRHFVPTIGLRIETKTSGQIVGYSCDTEPIPGIVELAHHADLLLHEAAGAGPGHSSAAQAGEIASEARAKRLALIHYNVVNTDPYLLIDEARTTFSGPVGLAEDSQIFEI